MICVTALKDLKMLCYVKEARTKLYIVIIPFI